MRVCEWRRAIGLLEGLDAPDMWGKARLKVWRAKCWLQLSEPAKSRELALQACDTALGEGRQLRDYARLILAKSMVKLGEHSAALRLLAKSTQEAPESGPLRRMLSELVINVHGDWAVAARLLRPIQDEISHDRVADAFAINQQLYVGSTSAETLTANIRQFADRFFANEDLPNGEFRAPNASTAADTSRRPRLGLISPMFHASPVYFLCIGALRQLSQEFDLVFFSRDQRSNWAADAFQSIAVEWHDVAPLSASALAKKISRSQLHTLIDLSGWLDLTVLEALAKKPAPAQIKWAGGQSTTTGLRSFDAYVSDIHQSPAEASRLHSEPLALMPGGYVTYTPPPYMPQPKAAARQSAHAMVGVVGHPKKVSRAFLAYLVQQMDMHNAKSGQPVELQFIGWQYGEATVQRRLQAALSLSEDLQNGAIRVTFVASKSHVEQLSSIGSLDWIVDTFPYTGGLTALEALALGIPYRTHAGQHSSARHAFSHAKFAGLQQSQFDLQTLGAFRPGPLRKSGKTLLPESSARKDHARLAADLARLIHNPTQFVAL